MEILLIFFSLIGVGFAGMCFYLLWQGLMIGMGYNRSNNEYGSDFGGESSRD